MLTRNGPLCGWGVRQHETEYGARHAVARATSENEAVPEPMVQQRLAPSHAQTGNLRRRADRACAWLRP